MAGKENRFMAFRTQIQAAQQELREAKRDVAFLRQSHVDQDE